MEETSVKEHDIPEEPSVTSDDPEERKFARRLRIQRRIEALKKQEGTEDEGIIDKSATWKQIETSGENLEKLMSEAEEVVTNVKLANNARALDRRREDIAIRNSLLKKLEEEAEDSMKKYRVISEKWSGMLASNDPLDIDSDIRSRREECEEILKQKDLIIEELRRELKNADDKFAADLRKQSEDINLLIERIETQARIIAQAYQKELRLIDEALDSERSTVLESVAKKWDALYKKRFEVEMSGVERRREIMREYEIEMERVTIDHLEKCRSEKIELETECQNLEQEVQRMKAICTMNIEKLNYGYAVLKHREDENIIIKTQQKRRINKLQDVVNGLKKNYNELEESTRSEIQKLSDQVAKARKNMTELEAKSRHFAKTNEKQYFDIWEMNAERANELVDKIMTADRIIHEQILGLDWEPPELTLLVKEDLPSYRKATDAIRLRQAEIDEGMKALKSYEKPKNLNDFNSERRLLNDVLRQISDHTGFLIEDRLRELLVSRTLQDNIIIRLDNVFQALGIKSGERIDLLLNFFLPYSYCPTCANREKEYSMDAGELEKQESSRDEDPSSDVEWDKSQIAKVSEDGEKSGKNIPDKVEVEESENGDDAAGENSATSFAERSSEDSGRTTRKVTCDKGHLLEIESADVTKALRDFVEKYRANEPRVTGGRQAKMTIEGTTSLSRSLTNEDIENYWKRYSDIFSTNKEKLWDGLLIGLGKYRDVLKERHRLNDETEALRKQNGELKRLLETYAIKPRNDVSILPGARSCNKNE